ncbi:MAG: hypothetical protein CL920_37495 [Deltaproteobacteria bacterium]|nr:hypothetical protein [Deltaproteobacteria bacterium]MBU54426.1 hypothetical protein [Deltaproteobacteria bacterium]|tara:strand:- start:457 stop:1422 length:966 start_codon:yes stop_codon:yes gene_type:complete
MEDSFHESQLLDKKTLTPLMRRTSTRSIIHFSIQYILLIVSVAMIIWRYGKAPWQWLLPAFVFALMVIPMFAVGHETTHRTAFRARWLNELVLWLSSLPIFYVPSLFRHFHFAHHRYTHDPLRDPEISIGGKPAPGATSSLFMYISFLSGLPLMLFKIGMMVAASIGHGKWIWDGFLNYVPERARRRVRWEARVAMVFHIAVLYIAIYHVPALWIVYIANAFGHLLLTLLLVSEHNGLPHSKSITESTRTTLTNPLILFLMWNMPYHTEHHAYPAIPWHALPQLHTLMQPELKHLNEKGYPHFHSRVTQTLLKGQPYTESP